MKINKCNHPVNEIFGIKNENSNTPFTGYQEINCPICEVKNEIS